MTEGSSSSPPRPVLVVFAVVSAMELVSVALLLGNLVTVHWRPVTSILGPVHGACYLSVVAIALLARGFRSRARLLSCVPVFGGGYVLWFVRGELRRGLSVTRSGADLPAHYGGDD